MRHLWLIVAWVCTISWDTGWSQNGRNYRPGQTQQQTREIPGQGVIVGKEIISFRAKTVAFLGIPYAEPPVKKNRFLPPKTPAPSWSGMKSSTKFTPACMQLIEQFKEYDRILLKIFPDLELNEDCLYLNIFIPEGPSPPEGWPVLLWFHPGNWSVGTANLWDGSAIAIGQKIIVVTANYRLNIFGFFTTMDKLVPGNAGLLDQVAALDWVREKISAFGGNPKNIVLSGHSSGATSVALHLFSPLSRDKFSRAILMSAPGLIARSVKSQSQFSRVLDELTDAFGCERPSKRLLECLQKQEAMHLMKHTAHLFPLFGPVVDANYAENSLPFLVEEPLFAVENHHFAKVPTMLGYTEMEDALIIGEAVDAQKGISWDDFHMVISESVGIDVVDVSANDTCLQEIASTHLADTALFYYTPRPRTDDLTVLRDRLVTLFTEKYYGAGVYSLATALTVAGASTYVYRFDYKIKTDNVVTGKNDDNFPAWVTAPHQSELPFVWGMPYWTNMQKTVIGKTQDQKTIMWKTQDRTMTDIMLNLWGNFVRTGNPTQAGITFRWDVFRDNTTGILLVDRSPNMSDTVNVDYKAFEFWNEYYPKVYNVLLRSCNMTSAAHHQPHSDMHVILLHLIIAQLIMTYFQNKFVLCVLEI